MEFYPRKLITIVTEAVIEHSLLKDLEAFGAHGYTVTDARGKGSRGARSSEWEASNNVRIEIVCQPPVADAIVEHLTQRYYADYAMIVFVSDVSVCRPEKF
jgi:nitrogen regulatory protein PII